MRQLGLLAATVAGIAFPAAAPVSAMARAGGVAPGRPGVKPDWLPADKQGFGTSTTRASRTWFTLEGGELSEVYYPRIDTPSLRDLQFVVTGPHGLVETERRATTHAVVQPDPRSLTYEQIDTERHGRWELTQTYVTDPRRPTVLIHVSFRALTPGPYHLYVVANPSLDNGASESGTCGRSVATVRRAKAAAAIATRPALTATECGYRNRSDGLLDLRRHHALTHHYRSAPHGNVVVAGRTTLTGGASHRDLTLALAFGANARAATATARASLTAGYARVARRYDAGWHGYLGHRKTPPDTLATANERRVYVDSEMILAASEDKTYRGAYVASPTMPWQWGTGLQTPTGPYHLVWARDLYEIATGLIADGDVAGAKRALHFLFTRQQRKNGSFPQNSDVTGKPVLTNLQLDEVADPIILAELLGSWDGKSWRHVERSANFLVGWHDGHGHRAPYSPQERWENQAGYSPATIASEIAGLVCAADIARRNGHPLAARKYLATADRWRAHLNTWTLTTNGPLGGTYYLRLSKNGRPNSGARYAIGDSGPSSIDQRRVVDPSFLELTRLGILPPKDPNIARTVAVVDRQLSVTTPFGTFWHRYSDDGYGEQRSGRPWTTIFPANSRRTIGRAWPLLTGERGEYDLELGDPSGAAAALQTMADAATPGGLLPEQVWDGSAPGGRAGHGRGRPTTSATPLAWTHAQLIRLAWSMTIGGVIEEPPALACRYARICATQP